MASTFSVSRKHLIFGICLPLALLLGYLLADAQDPISIMVVFGAIFALCIPILMKWYHPLLICAWNMGAFLALPGRPALWAIFAVLGFVVIILNRAVTDEESRLSPVPSLTIPLAVFAVVIVATAIAAGGINLGVLRSGAIGGKNYFYLICAIAGYFVLASRSIPPYRATFYVALFFLPSILATLPRLAQMFGNEAVRTVSIFFAPDFDAEAEANVVFGEIRLRSVAAAAMSVLFWLLARYGAREILNWKRPWCGLLCMVLIGLGTFSGHRAVAVVMCLALLVMFCLEGLWRTQAVLVLACALVLGGAGVVAFAKKMPFVVQRTLSFLPLDLDPAVEFSAEVSSTWRLEMWREALKQVPDYLLRGKGYTVNADDMYMSTFAINSGYWRNWEWALTAGDYHNGPLSLLIPFGIYGFLAFVWLIIAGIRHLYRVWRASSPELHQINTLLLGLFLVQAFFFMTIYGAIAQDLFGLTGILGLSVALNATHQTKTETQPATNLEISPQI